MGTPAADSMPVFDGPLRFDRDKRRMDDLTWLDYGGGLKYICSGWEYDVRVRESSRLGSCMGLEVSGFLGHMIEGEASKSGFGRCYISKI